MAYDVVRQEVVMFGGWDRVGGGPTNDTWVWDGTDWTQKQPPNSPPNRGAFGMAYDETRRVVVVFAGLPDTYRTLGDMWIWDGTTWTQERPTTSPSARRSTMAYDVSRQRAVLMGGGTNAGSLWADTWTWNGSNWTQEFPAATPAPRIVHSLTYDRARTQVVLFGGVNLQNERFQDTWIWGPMVPQDTTAPITTVTATPLPNTHGWNNTDVTGVLNASDNEGGSGVKQIQWALEGPQNTGLVTVPGSIGEVIISAEGTNALSYYATDNAGNVEAPKTLNVNIDKTSPVMTCSATPNILWPPNKKMVRVTVTVNLADSLSGQQGFVLASTTNNEPDAGAIQGFLVGTSSTAGSLKADRLGNGNGRVYTLTYQGKDNAGNVATCVATVTVPHDRGK